MNKISWFQLEIYMYFNIKTIYKNMRNFIKLNLITFCFCNDMQKLIFQQCMYRRIVFYPFYSHTCSLEQDSVGKWLKYCRYNVNRLVIIKSTFWNGQTEDLHVFDEHFIDNLRHYLIYLYIVFACTGVKLSKLFLV